MTKEQLADLLNGRQYRSEITKDEEAQAKASGLLVIFGASDDLVEFRGVVHDEIGAYNGTTFRICPEGLLPDWPDEVDEGWSESEAEDYFRRKTLGFVEFEALWDEGGYSWVIQPSQSFPIAVFSILDDSDNYCRGIVIDMADLTPTHQEAAGQEQDERAAFEAWAISYSTIPLKRDDDASLGFTGYTEMDQTLLWDAWQAAMAHAREAVESVAVPRTWDFATSRHSWVTSQDFDDYRAAVLRALGEQ